MCHKECLAFGIQIHTTCKVEVSVKVMLTGQVKGPMNMITSLVTCAGLLSLLLLLKKGCKKIPSVSIAFQAPRCVLFPTQMLTRCILFFSNCMSL